MNYELYSYRHGVELMNFTPDLIYIWEEIDIIISSITDIEIIQEFNNFPNNKSISKALNKILKEKFINNNWNPESPIFQPYTGFIGSAWRLDFAKSTVSLEVAFNHNGTAPWNLLKPTLASELNHVEKAIQTEVGVIITANRQLKSEGGFDGAIADFENYIAYTQALRTQLTVPLIIIGLQPLDSFLIEVYKISGKNRGRVIFK